MILLRHWWQAIQLPVHFRRTSEEENSATSPQAVRIRAIPSHRAENEMLLIEESSLTVAKPDRERPVRTEDGGAMVDSCVESSADITLSSDIHRTGTSVPERQRDDVTELAVAEAERTGEPLA